jgi:hypothetical protein
MKKSTRNSHSNSNRNESAHTATQEKPSLPHTIRCVVTGQSKGVRPDVLQTRIDKAGSLEALQASYLSADARRMLREGMTVQQIRDITRKSNPKDPVPNTPVPASVIQEYIDKTTRVSAGSRAFNISKSSAGDKAEQFVSVITSRITHALRPIVKQFVNEGASHA